MDIDDTNDNRTLALFAAVLHHGLANLAPDARPCGPAKVIESACEFEDYLNGVPIHQRSKRSR